MLRESLFMRRFMASFLHKKRNHLAKLKSQAHLPALSHVQLHVCCSYPEATPRTWANAFHCLEKIVTCVNDHVQHQFMLPNLGNLFRAWIGAKNDLSVNFNGSWIHMKDFHANNTQILNTQFQAKYFTIASTIKLLSFEKGAELPFGLFSTYHENELA